MNPLVKIGALAHGGAFVGDLISSESDLRQKKTFIRGVVPGEVVEARIEREEKNLTHSSLVKIIEPSPERVTPPCPQFGLCGGCDLQHMTLSAQRQAKRAMVERSLQFQGRLTAERGVSLIGNDLPGLNYRRRITLHLNSSGELGFYRMGSGAVVPIEECFLARPPINAAIRLLKPLCHGIREHCGGIVLEENAGKIFYLFKLRDGAAYDASVFERAAGTLSNVIVEQNGTIVASQEDFLAVSPPRYPTGHFSQVNDAANEILVAHVCASVQGAEITELYAGSGNFSVPLARAGKLVDAVEADPALIQAGEALAADFGLQNKLKFFGSTCERYARKSGLRSSVVLDPPRSGIKTLLEYFSPQRQQEITYVSCSLPTLTRDLKFLVERGFRLRHVAVLDMFPQTHHVETISTLTAC